MPISIQHDIADNQELGLLKGGHLKFHQRFPIIVGCIFTAFYGG